MAGLQPERRSAQQKTAALSQPNPCVDSRIRISRLILQERFAKATHDSAERVIRQTGSSVTSLCEALELGSIARVIADVGSRISIHASRDAIRAPRRRRHLCVDERRQGGDKTPAGLWTVGASDGGAASVAPGAASTACALVSDWSTRVSSATCGAVVVDAAAASGERDI